MYLGQTGTVQYPRLEGLLSKPVSLLVLLAVFLAGCAASASSTSSAIHHDPHVLEWGVIGVSDVPTLDPALVSDPTSISVTSLVYGGLVGLDDHLRVRPDGARTWSISPDGTVYTFHLRRHLRFSDGRLVTAKEFADAIERALGPAGSAGAASFYLGSIAHRSTIVEGSTHTVRGITVLNARTLRITLSHPSAYFLAELAYPVSYVADPTLLARFGTTWTDHAAGFGPYRVLQWSHTRSLTLVRNPYFWGGRPAFDRIVLHFYNESGALAAYRRGAIDMISGFQVGQGPPVHVTGVRRVPGLALDYLAFNTGQRPFHRLNTRRAFAAVWRRNLVRRALGLTAFPSTSFLPSAFGLSTPTWQPSESPSQYLKKAHHPHGRSLPAITLIVPRDPGIDAMAQLLATGWQTRLNINVQIRQFDPSIYDQAIGSHRFDIAIVRWGADYADPQDFLGTQLGSSSDNITGWSTPAYDDGVFLADSYHPGDPRRAALFERVAALAEHKVPLLPLDEPAVTAIIRPDLRGVALTALGTITGDWPSAAFING